MRGVRSGRVNSSNFETSIGPSARTSKPGACRAIGWPLARDVEKNHRGIDEGVFGVELRAERPGIVPERVVGNFDNARCLNAPGELVQLFDGHIAAVRGSGDSLHVGAEI